MLVHISEKLAYFDDDGAELRRTAESDMLDGKIITMNLMSL